MSGLTTEIRTVHEALHKLHSFCLQTHSKPPKKFLLGPIEYAYFSREMAPNHYHEFLNVPIDVSEFHGLGYEIDYSKLG